jgi:polyisoprenoid-binding protein YceI
MAAMRILAGLLALAVAGPPPGPAERVLVVSPRESRLSFTLDATGHTVHGTVDPPAGTLRLDPSGRVAGEIVVDLRSARTGNERRDRDMHAKVLETGRFPRAVFRPESLRGPLPGTGTVEVVLAGILSLHGVEHRVEIPARVTVAGARLTADGTLTIPYVAWGLTDPSKFVLRVGKTVEVRLHVAGTWRSSTPRPSVGTPRGA